MGAIHSPIGKKMRNCKNQGDYEKIRDKAKLRRPAHAELEVRRRRHRLHECERIKFVMRGGVSIVQYCAVTTTIFAHLSVTEYSGKSDTATR